MSRQGAKKASTANQPKPNKLPGSAKAKNESALHEVVYNLVVGRVSKQLILGIDGGATKTDWALCEMRSGELRPVRKGRLGPGSMKLLAPEALRELLSVLPSEASHVGVFVAGCATVQDRRHLKRIGLLGVAECDDPGRQ